MFGQISFNQGAFNRQTDGNQQSWSASAAAQSSTEAALHLIKYMSGQATAESFGAVSAGNVYYMDSFAEAVASAEATADRFRHFSGQAEAVSVGSAVGLYQMGTEFIALDIPLQAGDEVVIDTERMTLMINNINAIYALSDDSTFFNLAAGDVLTVSGDGAASVSLLWKDRWL